MRIGIFISSQGGSPLFDGLWRGFKELGHQVEHYGFGQHYDLLIFFNQCAHTTGYSYPRFPEDDAGPVVFIDSAEYGYFRRLPSVAYNYANAFSEGSLNHDTKNRGEQERLRQYLEGRSFPYFLREHLKCIIFPPSYHPIDYPLYYGSHCHLSHREQYMERSRDLFMCWGGSHPWRLPITEALRQCPVKSEIIVVGEGLAPRMPQGEYFNKTSNSKCSVSFDGYGSSSFRLTEVLVRCLLLKGPLSIRRHADLTHYVNCWNYDIVTNGEAFVSTNVCEQLQHALSDLERSFQIYQAGYHHCMEHYTEKATAEYVLSVVDKHNWSIPTPLSL